MADGVPLQLAGFVERLAERRTADHGLVHFRVTNEVDVVDIGGVGEEGVHRRQVEVPAALQDVRCRRGMRTNRRDRRDRTCRQELAKSLPQLNHQLSPHSFSDYVPLQMLLVSPEYPTNTHPPHINKQFPCRDCFSFNFNYLINFYRSIQRSAMKPLYDFPHGPCAIWAESRRRTE